MEVGVDGTLGTADGDLTMHPDGVETAECGQVKAFTSRIRNNGVDAVAGRVEVHQIHRRLRANNIASCYSKRRVIVQQYGPGGAHKCPSDAWTFLGLTQICPETAPRSVEPFLRDSPV